MEAARPDSPSLGTILREWGRLGCIGFGGPPAHIALLRELCVERRRWLDGEEFEDAIAATNLLPGPASTQLADLLRVAVGRERGGARRGAGVHPPRARADPGARGPVPRLVAAGVGARRRRRARALPSRRSRFRTGVDLLPPSLQRATRGRAGLPMRWPARCAATRGPMAGAGAARLRDGGAGADAAARGRRPRALPRCRSRRRAPPAACCRSAGRPSRSARSPTAAAS